ncbi:MAG: hydrogen peroxide-inducible genes activator [Rikenellaceae bacterium]|nr:hydrogen peroxide-inducible genes activator [Rikenellaceae bacterium]
MTIIQLEYLLAVANCGSFSQASELCFVTQPSLSMQIKNLEEELGVVLLDRSKKPVIPTEAGEVVIRNAKETLRAYNYIKESVNELKGEIAGTLRLGVIPTISPYLLHKFIPEFLKRYPKVDVSVTEMETAEICKALEKDMLDVAIIASGTTPEGIMEFEMFNDRFFAYVSPLNPLYERSNIRIEDIDPKQLVLLSQGHCLRDQVAELCQTRRHGSSRHNFEGGSLETLMHLVDCTSYITVIPEMATEFVPTERRNQVKTLAKGAASRKIALAVRRTYVKHSIIEALRSTIIEMVKGK